jgi:hypothetical protein
MQRGGIALRSPPVHSGRIRRTPKSLRPRAGQFKHSLKKAAGETEGMVVSLYLFDYYVPWWMLVVVVLILASAAVWLWRMGLRIG